MRTASLAGLALVLLLLAPSSVADSPQPDWRPGDVWEYSGWRLTDDGSFLHIAERIQVMDRGRVFRGGIHEAYAVQRVSTAVEGNRTIELRIGTLYYRTSDLSLVGEDLEVSGPDVLVEVSVTYAPPARVLRFPLAVGNRWAAAGQAVMTTSNASASVWEDPSATAYEVSMSEDLDLPVTEEGRLTVRTLHTVVVRSTLGPTQTWSHYAPEVGQFVKHVSYVDGKMVRVLELTSFTYAAEGPAEFPLVPVLAVCVAIPAVVLFAARNKISAHVRRTKPEP